MKKELLFICILMTWSLSAVHGQTVIRGNVSDAATGESLIGATIRITGTEEGAMTDWDGTFILETDLAPPLDIVFSYVGYEPLEFRYEADSSPLHIKLTAQSVNLDAIVIRGERMSDKLKSSPLTVESLDLVAIKETASNNFYDGLGALKDVDLTSASLGFKIINTRGFNSTSPVRSLQIIDGVDNQAPGLNFSLGNFLGSSELDVNKVDVIVGASSAFYGPNAFNGVISMETKDPFFHHGLSAYVKRGERQLWDTALRWGQVLRNKNQEDWMAYKLNFSFLKARDWEADNFNPVYETETGLSNPGGYDAVNIYGIVAAGVG